MCRTWRGLRRGVIGDLIKALRPTGIKLILYIHPSDGHDFSPEDQERAGWNDGPKYAQWNDFMNDVIAEVVDRYGADVAGYWIDGGLPPQVDPARLRQTVLSRDPQAWLIQNSGLNRACVDFGAHETFAEPFAATAWQMNAVISGGWEDIHGSSSPGWKRSWLEPGRPRGEVAARR